MHTEFQKILDQVQAKAPAARTFEAEGTTYIRNFRPSERLILLGCGHIAQPVCRYAADLGFSVTVADDRPSFANLNLLEEEGFSREALDKIHTPIGVDIGALTVKEIAVSIVAELIQCRRQSTERRSRSTTLTAEDIDLPLLQFLAEDPAPKALLTVIETQGSTPVKSGAMMAVDQALRMAGTIGGGCSENAVLMDAYRIIGTGAKRCVTIDMSNDVAEEEGMVCGGQMKVMIEDIPEKG